MEQRTSSQEPRIEDLQDTAADTRASMTEKLEVLEDRVRETLADTRSAVDDIVENVKGTVDDTVGAVKDTVGQAKTTVDSLVENVKETADSTTTMVRQSFDLQYQVEQRPWLMFGGAVFAGYVLGNWTRQDDTDGHQYLDEGSSYDDDDNLYAAAMSGGATVDDLEEQHDKTENGYAYPPHTAKTDHESSSDRTRTDERPAQQGQSERWQFQEEWDIIKSVALGTVMGTVRAMVRQQMPTLAPHIDNVFNRLSEKWSAKPIEPTNANKYSGDKNRPHASESYAAYTSPTEPSQTSTSASQGGAENPSRTRAKPNPYMHYRR
jgi:ElaB/YqjD/DUF883 family membrane-anchored ribosome-binding protein